MVIKKDLQLFETASYLVNKLGKNRFENIPQKPGIYRFYDVNEKLIYVGKAKNLRKRLFTYKRASAGKTTRKEAGLIRKIHRFEYDVLGSEKEALLAENRWIREKRPEFNHQNKNVETYYFIILYALKNGFGLEYTMSASIPVRFQEEKFEYRMFLNQEDKRDVISAELYGCFKGHRSVRIHLGNLLKLFFYSHKKRVCPFHLPVQLSRYLTPKRYFFTGIDTDRNRQHIQHLQEWLTGTSPEFVYRLLQDLDVRTDTFQQRHLCETIEGLLTYFDRSLVNHRNFLLKKKKREEPLIIFQDELDDLMVCKDHLLIN